MTRLARPWLALALVATAGGACATAGHLAQEGVVGEPDGAWRAPSRREIRDSMAAQEIADAVGPRVTIRATMDDFSGSRRVEADFHAYDDAYVLVGHLDALGRMRVVFPLEPGDDGFVKGNKIYHVPSFFAGFTDEYRWRYAEYRYRYQSIASRRDSYDAGAGYVFVIASWRPMRLDRITDGNRWQSYEVADINYMADPREAIEELGGLLAGDNREAYTIEYARYTTTNYGTYSLAAFNNCYGLGFGYGGFGFSAFARPLYSLGYSRFGGCGGYGFYSRYAFGYRSYPVAYTPVAPPIFRPPVLRPPITATPITRRPSSGTTVVHRPNDGATAGNDAPTTPTTSNLAYRRRGLVAEDAPPPGRLQNSRRAPVGEGATSRERPSLHEMIGQGRLREAIRREDAGSGYGRNSNDGPGLRASGSYRGGLSQPRADESNGRRETWSRAGGGGGDSRMAGSTGGYSRAGSSRSEPRNDGGREAGHSQPSAPTPARAQPSSPPPSAQPRSEPSSSGERRKPGA